MSKRKALIVGTSHGVIVRMEDGRDLTAPAELGEEWLRCFRAAEEARELAGDAGEAIMEWARNQS